MKIGQNPDNTPAIKQNGGSAGSAAPAASAAPATAIPARADDSAKIALSKTASSLLEGGSSNAEFDAEKVARISRSIDDGSFKIDPAAIADKLLSNAKELLDGSRN